LRFSGNTRRFQLNVGGLASEAVCQNQGAMCRVRAIANQFHRNVRVALEKLIQSRQTPATGRTSNTMTNRKETQ
jgi:hypothetical protein